MNLAVDLTDLNQTVLARLDNRRAGTRVELGLNRGRRAFVPLSLEDPARDLVSAIDTVLRVTLQGPGFSLPLFIGRVVIPERLSEPENRELGIHAIDPFFQLERALIRAVSDAGWQPVTFVGADQSQIMWSLIAARSRHGVVKGSLPESVQRDRTYAPGKEVGPALVEMSEVVGGPDFELQPTLATDGTLATFNTYYPHQGTDRSAEVIFVHGASPHTAVAMTHSPGGEEIVNRALAIGAPKDEIAEGDTLAEHPGFVAEHPESIARYGPFERRLSLDDVIETDTLADHAMGAVASAAFPIPYFDITAAPEQVHEEEGEGVPPVFGRDYWLGDTIAAHDHAVPDGAPLKLTGRVTDAIVTERESAQLEVKTTCSPVVAVDGVAGQAVTVLVPAEVEE